MVATSPAGMSSVLIVDEEPGIRNILQNGLQKHFALLETAEDAHAAESLTQRCHFDLIILDIRLPGRSAVEWVTQLRAQGCPIDVIFMTAHADIDTAISALRAGAEDFILKPFKIEQIIASVERFMARQKIKRENFVLRREVEHIVGHSGMVGKCELIKDICQVIKRVAPMPSTVLIEGESGTGKELAARAIHEWSGRSGSFVPINCGAMSAELLESELFGHVKGAFTGAGQPREGLFTYANGGTLFLDEIGEMPFAMQVHLLRILEERTVRPVGSNCEVPVDVRILAATNRDLAELVRQGSFREDLYYRLNVLAVRMPALRERVDDIPVLARHFINTVSIDLGIESSVLEQTEISRLQHYDWPGNVRELKNVIERSLLLNSAPSRCLAGPAGLGASEDAMPSGDDLLLESVERQHILRILEQETGNKSAAARLLGISRKTLERKVQAWAKA